ncbi:MAG: hypothetical protein JW839_15340, partial [Candidatus Lokiarchaeota archaeon]|nr:hypothetical protein [Candidatus Lokiarchaeota archaeon]
MNATTNEGFQKQVDDVRWEVDAMARGFQQPPNELKPFTRWWWFGTASREEIRREMEGMSLAGFGGVEIQTIYSALPGHPVEGYHDMAWLGDEWLDMVACAVETGKELGMQVDLTFGSGWPFGGPHIDKLHASCRLASHSTPLAGGEQIEIPLDELVDDPRRLVGIIAGRVAAGDQLVNHVNLQHFIKENVIVWHVPAGDWTLFWFFHEPTGQMVKRAAPGGEGLVMDHLSREAFSVHARRIDERLKARFGPRLGDHFGAFFCDSWEVFGENWTPKFASTFKERAGYDITDYLPALEIAGASSRGMGENGRLVNYDYKKHHADLIIEEFFQQFADHCHRSGVECRVQPYMAPTDMLLAYGLLDVPEIEGFGHAGINSPYYKTLDPRLASSSAHVYGKPLVSCESFTWLKEHFTASIDDVKEEADQIIICGVNRIIYHGYAFSPLAAGVPGWQFYASIELNHNNTWWYLAGELNGYIARNAFLSRQGHAVAMFAVYLPMHDEWMGRNDIRRDLKVELRESGYLSDYDYVNDERLLNAARVVGGQLVIGEMRYHALVLYKTRYLPAAVARKIAELVKDSLPVFCIETSPSTVPGLKAIMDKEHLHARPAFDMIGDRATIFPSVSMVREHLEDLSVQWDFTAFLPGGTHAPLQYLHRECDVADLYFIVNPSNECLETRIVVPATGAFEFWMPDTAERVPVRATVDASGLASIDSCFKAKEAKWLVVLKSAAILPSFPPAEVLASRDITISEPWDISFDHPANAFPLEAGMHKGVTTRDLFEWTSREATRYFSGTAIYRTTIDIPLETLEAATRLDLDLGTVHGMPETFINGERYFAFKHGQDSINVTRSIRPGANQVE